METTKFHELCNAYDTAQTKFDTYRTDCHIFSMEFVKELKNYYDVPESQFSLYKINQESGFQLVPPALIHAIRLAEDHYWHFGLGLTVCKAAETLPEELILIHILFKKNSENTFNVRYANSKEKFKITKGDATSYAPFFDFLFSIIIKSYNEKLQEFVGEKTTRKLGYRH